MQKLRAFSNSHLMAVIFFLSTLLTGCGQTGPLYLPLSKQPTSTTAKHQALVATSKV